MAADIPELLDPPHKASGLPRWLEWTTAISAIIVSVCSIGIASTLPSHQLLHQLQRRRRVSTWKHQ